MHSSEGRNVFTLIGGGEDQCNFWKFEPIGENVRIQDVKSGKYLYVPIHNSKHNNNGSNVSTGRTKDEKSLWRFENCGFTRNKRDIQPLESRVSLDSKAIKVREKARGVQQTSVLSEKLQRDFYLLRKPLAIDLSSQPEIVASSSTRPSSWINDLFSWMKSSMSRLLGSRAALTETSANYSNTAGNQYTSQFSSGICISNNVGLGFFLLQNFLDKKYPLPNLCSVTPEEALADTLNIVGEFEKTLEKTAKQSGVSVKGFDFFKVYLDVAGHVRNERYSQIPNTLYSIAKEACPKNEKFLSILKGNIEKMFNEQQIVNSGYQPNYIADSKPRSYLSNTTVDKHLQRSYHAISS